MAVVLNKQISVANEVPGLTRPMTYEEYLASPLDKRRYDVLDGWKVYRKYGEERLPSPSVRHQRIQANLLIAIHAYAVAKGYYTALGAPCDVLVESGEKPRTRQPDVLLISNLRLAESGPEDRPKPLQPAPELVVEIISRWDSGLDLTQKIADYKNAGVLEIWVVKPDEQIVELKLLVDNASSDMAFRSGNVKSTIFDDLSIPLEVIFS